MSVLQLVGLSLVMVALKDATFEHVGFFLRRFEHIKRSEVLGILRGALSMLYTNQETSRWIVTNFEHLKKNSLPLIEYMERHPSDFCYSLLQISRLVSPPKELGDLKMLCEQYCRTKFSDWIERCLASTVSQPTLEFDKFQRLAYEMRISSRAQLMRENKDEFLEPITFWQSRIVRLLISGSSF